MYPGGQGEYASFPGCGLLRLHSTYRHDLKVYASDEGRVQMTAAAFAKVKQWTCIFLVCTDASECLLINCGSFLNHFSEMASELMYVQGDLWCTFCFH